MAQEVQQQLEELGSKLESPPTSKEALLDILEEAVTILSNLDQSPSASTLESMQPFLKAIVNPELLKHQDKDIELLVACCLCEITRITAPEAPYSDDILRDTFGLIVATIGGFDDRNGPSFERRVNMLETLARYRSCVVMLDLECDDLVNEMFRTFIAMARDEHPEKVLKSIESIMTVLLEESEDVQEDLLITLLSALGQDKKDVTQAARNLTMSVIEDCAEKLEPAIKQLLISSMSGDRPSHRSVDYREVMFNLYRCSPQTLSGIVPYLTGELLTDQSESRLRAVKLVGELFAITGQPIVETFQPVFAEFLKRLTDRVVEVRMLALEHIKSCLLSNPSRSESSQIYAALCDRLLDYDENVRKQVVAVVCDVACHDLNSVPIEAMKLVAERLRDKSPHVKKYTMDRLAEIFRLYCLRSTEGFTHEYDWVPGKIMRCFYDKDFRSDAVECMLSETLFPSVFTVKDKVKQWIRTFPGLEKVEVKAFEKILEQKLRLQQEMQKYLSFRQAYKDFDAPDYQKKAMLFFRVMSRCFADPAKAEEGFLSLDQLKDASIWNMLLNILDPNLSVSVACNIREDMLKIVENEHKLFAFLSILSIKCSYILFNKEHVKETFLEVVTGQSTGDSQHNLSCMNMLVILARYNPLLFLGSEEELLKLLKEDDDIVKEGILHVLATAGGTIREQLAASSTSVDLTLERLCLEGSRKQAKYAVHALAAITKDDGLLSLSVLYKRLVDMLEDKTHLPSVLESLGCIAQTAMAVFETRENEIVEFIQSKILHCSSKTQGKKKRWRDRSDLCLLKIYGIKLLVKSYSPVKDAHLRAGIDNIIEILKNILLFGEVSKEIESSLVDKAHMRFASAKAVLRLSRYWDHKIPADVFHLTLRAVEITFPQARKIFRSKVHQYIKDRVLDAKYACAFLLSTLGSRQAEIEEDKRSLADIIQMCWQLRARQLSVQPEANMATPYPEYMLTYLIHVLAHHRLFPSVDECKNTKAFEPVYRILYLFLSMLVRGEEVGMETNAADKEKQCLSTVTSILQCIKHSEDVVDVAKSKNSYAICDLGFSIIKRISEQLDPSEHASSPVSLPPTMYKPKTTEDGTGPEAVVSTWLADDSVIDHFNALQLEVNGTASFVSIPSVTAQDEILEDNEVDGNDMPLGKLIKHIKSQKVKARKGVVENSSPGEVKNSDDVDVIKVVREINLDGLGISNKFDSSNGHKNLPRDDQVSDKRKRSYDSSSVSVPKRQRSSSSKSPSSDITPRSVKVASGVSEKRSMEDEKEPGESELLVSRIQKKRKQISSGQDKGEGPSDEGVDSTEKKKLGTLTEKRMDDTAKSLGGSLKKPKKRSVAGLSKCSSAAGKTRMMDLVDCRIKVWWPLDKKFYTGVVKSYDQEKKMHVVLYDDGEVEVLRLHKERWELIDEDSRLSEKSNIMESVTKESPNKKTKFSDRSSVKKLDERTTTAKRKRTPKKESKREGKYTSWGQTTSVGVELGSDLSDPEPAFTSKVAEFNTGTGQEDEKLDSQDECSLVKEEPNSGLGQEVDAGEGDDNESVEEDEKPKNSPKRDENRSTKKSPGDSDEGESGTERKKNADKPSGDAAQHQRKEVQRPESAQKKSAGQIKACYPEITDADDDEPLGVWKRRVVKSTKQRKSQ